MPKYREEHDKLRPIPGAFGLERDKERWFRANRPDVQFLDGLGRYGASLRILVDEEYGYRDWLWTFPGTVEELVEQWRLRRMPLVTAPHLVVGRIDEIRWTYYEGGASPVLVENDQVITCITSEVWGKPGGPHGYAHIHQDDDSFLKVSYYELRGLDNVVVDIHVLDALASL